MPNTRIKISIFLNYFLFAILLNSVGTVILQVQRFFKVAESSASILEACKDISIAVASFLVASFITRIGYKKSMLIALGLMTLSCFIMPFVQTFIYRDDSVSYKTIISLAERSKINFSCQKHFICIGILFNCINH